MNSVLRLPIQNAERPFYFDRSEAKNDPAGCPDQYQPMANSLPSPRVRTFLVSETGELLSAGRRQIRRAPATARAVLSRGLCRFEFLPPASGVSGSAAQLGCRVAAETRAPFAESGGLVTLGAEGFGAWRWDAKLVRERLGDAWPYDLLRIVPESRLLYPVGDGLRQLATLDGFEAQFWENGTLIASSWRRRAFTQDQWDAFVRTSRAPAALQDASVPEPIPAELRLNKAATVPRLRDASDRWNSVERAGIAVSVLSILAMAFSARRHFASVPTRRANSSSQAPPCKKAVE